MPSRTSSTGSEARFVRFEERRAIRTDRLAVGSLACPGCDAPVAPGPDPLALSADLTCPFCGEREAVRDFLSLALPTRPARVVIRVALDPSV